MHQGRVFRRLRVDDHRAARNEQIVEQPHLGGAVVLHRAVIIEMIAGQIRKSGGTDRYAFEAELIETMARCFERHALKSGLGHFMKLTVQFDRIRRGQTTRGFQSRPHEAEGTEARGLPTHGVPNLAGKGGDRSLAVGAGHSGDGFGLIAVKGGRHTGQAAARIIRGDEGNTRGDPLFRHVRRGQNRRRTSAYCRIDIVASVELCSRNRGKKVSRSDRAAIRGQSCDRYVVQNRGLVQVSSIQ